MQLGYRIPAGDVNWAAYEQRLAEVHQRLHSGQEPMTGWVEGPLHMEEGLLKEIQQAAREIQEKCTALVVIGIGGSYLGARACIELLQSPFYNEYYAKRKRTPKVYFAGHHLSSMYYQELFERLQEEEVCLCVISKSGTTLEPAVIFDLFKRFLAHKYPGKQLSQRIYAITDASRGALREEADREGYKTFVVPDDIGGRYSVLTPVGLLPIAVAGIDIEAIITGARSACLQYQAPDWRQNACYQYGILRHHLASQGKIIEVFEVYEGKLRYFTEWLKQLFGESECKDGKGILPVSLQMSTDLHSMGQFLQEGRQNFFETVVMVDHVAQDVPLLDQALAGPAESLHALNLIVQRSAQKAHLENGTPNIQLTMGEISPEAFGEMVYFFEKACAVSCYLTGVNPFDQPGVEGYKRNIKEALRKP